MDTPGDSPPTALRPEEVIDTILDIIYENSLNKMDGTMEQLILNRPKSAAVIQQFINKDQELKLCLPAFPFKSANKEYKVLGILPDKAEELALERLNTMCARIQRVYPPGANLTIISDGLVYNDLLGISDRETWAYGQALRAMAKRMQLHHISFSRIRDLVDFPGPQELNEITYVASATNFRRCLINQYGDDNIDIEERINADKDTMMTYLGYRRFLVSDLKYVFPLSETRSKNAYKKNVKFLAQEMLSRGYAFAGAVKAAFPNHLRLSIHHSTGEHKVSISLLNTNTGFTTPWHCSVALMANGEWLSAPKGDFEKDPRFEIVYEDGRPSYFRETKTESVPDQQEDVMDATSNANGKVEGQQSVALMDYSKHFEVVAIVTEKDQAMALIPWSQEGAVNDFTETSDPPLDPSSANFSTKPWLKSLMVMLGEDPAKYPRRVIGVAFQKLSVQAVGAASDYQPTFVNQLSGILGPLRKLLGQRRLTRTQILRDFDGLVNSGEMLLVLGSPGSGCSTLLKAISGQLETLELGKETYMNYQGTPREMMHKEFRGECIYQAEIDVHFPQLTVGQTLEFAARARAPQRSGPELVPEVFARRIKGAALQAFDLTHTVGNDFVRGVSGGERKRVSIAEAAVSGCPVQCWDNSTRGLDSATALSFVQTLRSLTELTGGTAFVSLYQVSEPIYSVFDKVTVLYQGRQVYFGTTENAKRYFEDLGFECLPRQTTADFITSVTNPAERRVRPGFERKSPRNADEFAAVWQKSPDFALLTREIEQFDHKYPLGGPSHQQFKLARNALQSKSQRSSSPYILSFGAQVKLCIRRGYQRLRSDTGITIAGIVFNSIMALVIGSVFYNLPNDTSSLYSRGALLFFGILLAAFASGLEVLTLYAQRPMVEKQFRYAFYQPSAEAVASMLCDLPNKILTTTAFDLVLYFMTNLRRTPSAFFVFLLFTFACSLTMSMYFRSIAALSRSLAQAMAPASVFSLALVIYTGFAIPAKLMHPWFKWLTYLNPVSYAFESLMINEFHGRRIPCSRFVPEGADYEGSAPDQRICATTGAGAGKDYVDGDQYLEVNFNIQIDHLWSNFGILIALMVLGCAIYLVATEYIREKQGRGEVLLFPSPRHLKASPKAPKTDLEATSVEWSASSTSSLGKEGAIATSGLQQQASTIHWNDICFDLKIGKETRRLLNNVDGWVKPGTLTVLMGVSGAGKTTLLDVLASRINVGVVGDILVDGRPRNAGFQRKACYAQQQDLHMSTSTVREALIFSALLRQPASISRAEKIAYVEEVIKILEMERYADAAIGVPGEGLNIEQRKRLTIGVELAAKPTLMLFLDEPTSGLDSQNAWSIVNLLRKLANNGQTILCTLHQPSAELFQTFDRLLYLAMEGKPVYFGDIGPASTVVTNYFEQNGARACGPEENPAEYILEVTGSSGPNGSWPEVWNASKEKQAVKQELVRLKQGLESHSSVADLELDHDASRTYAAPFGQQLLLVLYRNFQQYWRTPSYLYSKIALSLCSTLFIGFSFWKTPNSLQGLQNQLFAVFLLLSVFPNLSNQIMPHMLTRRQLYEARERSAKTYSWQAFAMADALVEVPWNCLMAVIMFCAWYYPIGLQHNAEVAGQVVERGGLMFLFILAFMVYVGTFTSMVLAGVDSAEAAGIIMNLLFSFVLASPEALPGFWIFMYRVSPFTYLVSGMLSAGLANAPLVCAPEEYLRFAPPQHMNCSDYLAPYIAERTGYLTPDSMSSMVECVFCTGSETNTFLKSVSSEYRFRWRNLGIFWVYVIFNMVAAVGIYWLVRVRSRKSTK
ncbi:hypothetical protein AC578_5083 [Pseudocercospora eumusae]|uniref:ABC transporter domain-containing protein n=1 Tax=Pseudocercospora eumusae TaxID=321146 RepID=A0A139HIK5_9PEZI|nr:hypothetical protein AC578_5083 [Pseudocercospora eumusae]